MLASPSRVIGENLTQDSHTSLHTPPPEFIPSLINLKLSDCGKRQIILRCDNPECEKYGQRFAVNYRCRLRLCPHCSKVRSTIWYHRFKNIKFQYPFHVVLTLEAGTDLRERLNLLIKAFRLLRKQKFTKSNGKKFKLYRGVYSIEINKSKSVKNGWHVHMHIMINCWRLEHAELSKKWERLTGATDVWVKHFDSIQDGLNEVLKGELKDSNGRPKHFTDQEKDYIERAIQGRRLVGSWGLSEFYSLVQSQNETSAPNSQETSAPNFYCPCCGRRLKYEEIIDHQDAMREFFDQKLLFYDYNWNKGHN